MDQFLQMDIFFFIASVAAVVVLLIATVVGIYVWLIIKRVNAIVREVRALVAHASTQGKLSIDVIKDRIEALLSGGGVTERIVATALGTIIAKTFKGRGKIRSEAPKKRTR